MTAAAVAPDADFDHATRRIGELVQALDALTDRDASATARELVRILLDLHGVALGRMMDSIVTQAGGDRLVELLVGDAAINGVLLLHGVHPIDAQTRVRAAMNRLLPHLGVKGIAVETVEVSDAKVRVHVKLSDAGRYTASDADPVRKEIERAVRDAAPDVASVEIDGFPVPVIKVPVSSIALRRKAAVAGAST